MLPLYEVSIATIWSQDRVSPRRHPRSLSRGLAMTHLLDRRRAVARTTLLVHVSAVIVLLVIMAGTEGPAAHGSGTSVTLAKLQLFLLAVAGLVQIFMAGRWTQYALSLHQV